MAKDFKQGIDNVFSPTLNPAQQPKKITYPENSTDDCVMVAYNVKYPKSVQKRLKRFCIDHDMDMKDVFIEEVVLYMDKYSKTTN